MKLSASASIWENLLPLLLAVGLSLVGGRLVAAEPTFVVREWHREEGLPSEVVSDVRQSRDGYLWLATLAGLVRFDGREFRTYPIPAQLRENRSGLVALDDTGDGLWVLSRTGDPLRFRDGVFTDDPLPKPLTGGRVTAAFVAPDGNRWLYVRGKGVIRLKGADWQLFDATAGINPDGAARFATDGEGRLWVSSDHFLGRYENETLVPIKIGTGESELRVVSSRVGGPWILTTDRLLKLDPADQPRTVVSVPRLVGAHYLIDAIEDRTGALWLGTRSQGVFRVTDRTTVHVPTSHESVNALFEDVDGTIWVGTNAGGLNAIGPSIHRLFDRSAGLVENVSYALCEADDGSIWTANGDGGVFRLAPQGAVGPRLRHAELPRFGVIAIAAKPGGGVWYSGTSGIFEANSAEGPAQRSVGPPGLGGARRMFVDAAGNLWLWLERGQIVRIARDGTTKEFGESDGYGGGEVRCFAEDANRSVWVGTTQGQVYRCIADRFEAVPWRLPPGAGAINAIHFEPDGAVWLGTALRGIVVVHAGSAAILDTQVGIPENNVTQLIADDRGFVWCGSGTAVFRLSRREVQRFVAGEIAAVNTVVLGRDDGLKAVACSGLFFPGAVKAPDGMIWFATRQGVLAIDPAAPVLQTGPRSVRIEELSAGERRLATAPVVNVPPDRRLRIRFSVLCLAAPRRVHAEYRLDGFDAEWISAGASNVASYPELRPGRYTFHVRAGVGANERDFVSDEVAIEVTAHWWQTTWFRVLAAGALLLLVATAVRVWSMRRLQGRLRELERERAVERERSRIAQNIHDDLGASLTHISLLTQAAIAETTPERLNRIYEATRDITRSLDEIVWAVNPRNDTFEGFAEYLASNAQRFLHAAGIRCRLEFPDQLPGVPVPSQVRHHLFLCCREALNNVVKHAHADTVLVELKVAEGTLTVAIGDNGSGLAATNAGDDGRTNSGNGLRNMRDRMAEVGGRCAVAASPGGRGTIVTLQVPFSPWPR